MDIHAGDVSKSYCGPSKYVGHTEIFGRIVADIYKPTCIRIPMNQALPGLKGTFVDTRLLRYEYVAGREVLLYVQSLEFVALTQGASVCHNPEAHAETR